ncbi:hypothetical protein EQM14_13795 [Caproiciproducens sp. NJN-50]|uniref:FUSC family protein n=1 Tax=Acutalibacteraceae TaxID=3082771 RepID=UPI000FFE2B50|nr:MULTISPECIES: aromatic acid exporter family protein [Acutalibacteraceae]QAT50750.1 hypothetical protein EQM14_13795 [Caproiciproducens sp. NJN-50]
MKRIFRFFRTNFRLGLRVVKTGIAVTFCIAISNLLHLNQPFIAVIATVISMGKSIDLSVKTGKNKMAGVVIGSAVGTAFAAILPGNAGLCGIGVILSLYLCHLFHLESAGVLSSFSFAAVMFGAAQSAPWKYALPCMGAALLGIAVAVVVNLTVMPPNYAVEIKKAYAELIGRTAAAIEDASARRTVSTKPVAEEIETLSRTLWLYISEAKILRWNDDEVFRISSSISLYRMVLDELKAVEVMELTEDGAPNEEILTVYRYHMKRMRELFERAKNS